MKKIVECSAWALDDLTSYVENIKKKKRVTDKTFNWKVVRPDGTSYLDYKRERVQRIFDEDGGRLYAVTKNWFELCLLVDWK